MTGDMYNGGQETRTDNHRRHIQGMCNIKNVQTTSEDMYRQRQETCTVEERGHVQGMTGDMYRG